MLSKEREVPRQFPDCNHGLLTSLCDRLGGSFRPSRDLEPEAPRPDKKWYQLTESFDQPEAPPAPERVALLPSPWATVAFAGRGCCSPRPSLSRSTTRADCHPWRTCPVCSGQRSR
ncbi:unnamed protein product [Prorocentrum cordatum]|uniref:Uncharacterized protein n=1 Tax=Prorocentrum cordatum TaxID=2364126 RepID=A0ABN9PDC9_9DINO|nr:unnamed protein product [Polarella glacialis]